MESRLCTLTSFLCCILLFSFSNKLSAAPNYEDTDIKQQIRSMECLVDVSSSEEALKYAKSYLAKGNKSETERLIGRTVLYFPIFEEILRKNNVPTELKYLSIVESSLNPRAISTMGAGGLWQFIPSTASIYGLRVNGQIDERADAAKSTEAAAKYLKNLYSAYNDWRMALAAYNCGGGTISFAIKRAHSVDFDKVKKFLPAETQAYIPKFIAASYIMKHYRQHGFKPQLPQLDLQLTTGLKIYTATTFDKIALATGISRSIVEVLNPHFRNGVVPSDPDGFYIVLPRRVMNTFLQQFNRFDGSISKSINDDPIIANGVPSLKDDDNYFKSSYTVIEGDKIEQLAEWFNCSPYNIMLWNNLSSQYLEKGQELTIYFPQTPSGKHVDISIKPLNNTAVVSNNTKQKLPNCVVAEGKPKRATFIYHQVGRNESLSEIAEQYHGVTVNDLLALNDLNGQINLTTGSKLKVKKQ